MIRCILSNIYINMSHITLIIVFVNKKMCPCTVTVYRHVTKLYISIESWQYEYLIIFLEI